MILRNESSAYPFLYEMRNFSFSIIGAAHAELSWLNEKEEEELDKGGPVLAPRLPMP